ncbi:TrgA family protein [Yoonia sp. SS1-5]|uniref:TrgA family protein n=1 Tax=Yoonia rhodophyticola TaxID=3137370 RepID=A0AAN0ME64_9RHOB
MPTAGRLAAALTFFIYGWYVGIIAGPFFPEGNPPNYVIPLSIGLAILVGWTVVGGRLGNGYFGALGHGLTGAFAYGFWTIFIISFINMIRKSLRRLYDGPMDAVVDVFDLMMRAARDFFDINLILTVTLGGMLCACIGEYFARRYP